jgi:uncharacterized protein (TIGR03435 family)
MRLLAWVLCTVAASMLNAPQIQAQSARSSAPKFEVASVKPCQGNVADTRGDGLVSSPARLHLPCSTLETLIEQAYGMYANDRFNAFAPYIPISGAPKWVSSDRYQVEAKAEGPQSQGRLNGSMLRALLVDRFGLKMRARTVQVPVYALVVTKGGPKPKPSREGGCMVLDFSDPEHSPLPSLKPGQPLPIVCGMGRVSGNGYDLPGATMATFCRDLSSKLDRPVVDRTGIAGRFDIHMDLSAEELGMAPSDTGEAGGLGAVNNAVAPHAISDPIAPFVAVNSAIRKLGLRLVPGKGPGESLVVERVERPSEN